MGIVTARRRIAAVVLPAAVLAATALIAAPAAAQDDGFCRTLVAAWTAARDAPQTLGDQRVAGATLCARAEAGLQCSLLLGTRENGRAAFERLGREAAACLAPLGLAPSAMTVAGSETILFESRGGGPSVAIIYPGNATVSIAVIPAP